MAERLSVPDLTICIVNFNTKGLLENCLSSIYQNTRGVRFEVFVVDNASSDGSVDMVKAAFPDVTLIVNKENVLFSKANNQAIRASQGTYALILNPDTVVLDGALRTMVEFMDGHPEAGVVGCRLINPDGTLQRTANRFPTLMFGLLEVLSINDLWPRNPVRRSNIYSSWDRNSLREVDAVSGACLMVRREAVAQVGLLDEDLFYYEEVDWCHRIKEANWKVYYHPDAQVVHHGGQSTGNLDPRALSEIYWKSFLAFYRKHYGCLVYAGLKTVLQVRMTVSRWLRRATRAFRLA